MPLYEATPERRLGMEVIPGILWQGGVKSASKSVGLFHIQVSVYYIREVHLVDTWCPAPEVVRGVIWSS